VKLNDLRDEEKPYENSVLQLSKTEEKKKAKRNKQMNKTENKQIRTAINICGKSQGRSSTCAVGIGKNKSVS